MNAKVIRICPAGRACVRHCGSSRYTLYALALFEMTSNPSTFVYALALYYTPLMCIVRIDFEELYGMPWFRLWARYTVILLKARKKKKKKKEKKDGIYTGALEWASSTFG